MESLVHNLVTDTTFVGYDNGSIKTKRVGDVKTRGRRFLCPRPATLSNLLRVYSPLCVALLLFSLSFDFVLVRFLNGTLAASKGLSLRHMIRAGFAT